MKDLHISKKSSTFATDFEWLCLWNREILKIVHFLKQKEVALNHDKTTIKPR